MSIIIFIQKKYVFEHRLLFVFGLFELLRLNEQKWFFVQQNGEGVEGVGVTNKSLLCSGFYTARVKRLPQLRFGHLLVLNSRFLYPGMGLAAGEGVQTEGRTRLRGARDNF